jgi:hypothetical protein
MNENIIDSLFMIIQSIGLEVTKIITK